MNRLKEIIQLCLNLPTTRQNLTTSLEQKIFDEDIQKYTDICFQSTSRMRFVGIKNWCSVNVISDTKQKHGIWNICKTRKGFSCAVGAYCSHCQRSWDSLNEWGFWANLYWVKLRWGIFIASFCCLWGFLLENLKLQNSDDVHWNVWRIWIVCMPKTIFSKKEF